MKILASTPFFYINCVNFLLLWLLNQLSGRNVLGHWTMIILQCNIEYMEG